MFSGDDVDDGVNFVVLKRSEYIAAVAVFVYFDYVINYKRLCWHECVSVCVCFDMCQFIFLSFAAALS